MTNSNMDSGLWALLKEMAMFARCHDEPTEIEPLDQETQQRIARKVFDRIAREKSNLSGILGAVTRWVKQLGDLPKAQAPAFALMGPLDETMEAKAISLVDSPFSQIAWLKGLEVVRTRTRGNGKARYRVRAVVDAAADAVAVPLRVSLTDVGGSTKTVMLTSTHPVENFNEDFSDAWDQLQIELEITDDRSSASASSRLR